MEKKIELNFAHLCDTAFLSQTGRLNIINIIEYINVEKLPNVYPRLTLVINADLPKGKHKIKIRIVRQIDKHEVTKLEQNLPSKGEATVGMVSQIMNIKFDEEGKYGIEIWIDDEPMKQLDLAVRLVRSINNVSFQPKRYV